MPIQEDVWTPDEADELWDALDPAAWGRRLLVARWLYRRTWLEQTVRDYRVGEPLGGAELADRLGLVGHTWLWRMIRELEAARVIVCTYEAAGRRPAAYGLEWRWWLWVGVPWLVPRETLALRMELARLRRDGYATQRPVASRAAATRSATQRPVVSRQPRDTTAAPGGASVAAGRDTTPAPYVCVPEVSVSSSDTTTTTRGDLDPDGGDGADGGAVGAPVEGAERGADVEARARSVLATANGLRRGKGQEGLWLAGRPLRELHALLVELGPGRDGDVAFALGNTRLAAPSAMAAVSAALGGVQLELPAELLPQPVAPAVPRVPVFRADDPPEPPPDAEQLAAAKALAAQMRAALGRPRGDEQPDQQPDQTSEGDQR